MARSRLILAVLTVLAVAGSLELAPRLSTLTSAEAAHRARDAFDGVFHGTHSDLQLGSFELAYRIHRARMGSAELLNLGVEQVRRDDGGEVSGNDWALEVSLAQAPSGEGERYLGNLRFQVGDQRPVTVSVDSARPNQATGYARTCDADAGLARTC